jgi:UDP:flavonoid glycosyltransferase YjiC (YdhE family)
MSRYLIATWPYTGHVYPHLAIARELRARGDEVAFYTGKRALPLLQAEGFQVFPFAALNEAAVDGLFYAADRMLGWRRPLRLLSGLRRWLVDTLPQQVADLEDLFAAVHFDVIICDATMWAPFVVLAETQGISLVATSSVAGCMIPGPDAPPWGMGLRPPRSWPTRLTCRCAARLSDCLSALTEGINSYIGRAPLYLVRGCPEFDFERRDLPASVEYVGPLLAGSTSADRIPPWLAGLRGDKPVVHVTEGSLQVKPRLLGAAIRALARDFRVIVTTGVTTGAQARSVELAKEIQSESVFVESWIPHGVLMPLCDAVITVGGAGTAFAAIGAGVPLVVVPSETDQFDTARRVAHSGAGLVLNARCGSGQMEKAVKRLCSEPRFRANARRVSDLFGRYRGAARAADLIGRFSARQKIGEPSSRVAAAI